MYLIGQLMFATGSKPLKPGSDDQPDPTTTFQSAMATKKVALNRDNIYIRF